MGDSKAGPFCENPRCRLYLRGVSRKTTSLYVRNYQGWANRNQRIMRRSVLGMYFCDRCAESARMTLELFQQIAYGEHLDEQLYLPPRFRKNSTPSGGVERVEIPRIRQDKVKGSPAGKSKRKKQPKTFREKK